MVYTPEVLRERLEALAADKNLPDATELEKALLPVFKEYRGLKDKNVIVLFSGGLDTSYIVHFLANVIGAKVETIAVNVGSTEPLVTGWDERQSEIEKRALSLGALRHETFDGREALANLAMSAVRAEAALGRGAGHPPGSSLSRPVICEAVMNHAAQHHCDAIFHGSNGSQNNPYRFRSGLEYYAKKKDLKLLLPGETPQQPNQVVEAVPNLDCPLTREQEEAYLSEFSVSVPRDKNLGAISTDENLCGNEREEAGLSDPSQRYTIFEHEAAQDQTISLRFEKGIPVALKVDEGEWRELGAFEMMQALNRLGYAHHIGGYDYAEARPNGENAREIHISPALAILNYAHSVMRSHIGLQGQNKLLSVLSDDWSSLVMECNLWASELREDLDKALETLNEPLSGEISLSLSEGRLQSPLVKNAVIRKEGTQRPADSADVTWYQKCVRSFPESKNPFLELHRKCLETIIAASADLGMESYSHASVKKSTPLSRSH